MAEAPSPDPDRCIVLVGKVGCGKSSSGNTILGRKAFRTAAGFSTETKTCERVIDTVCGRQIALVDTPGLDCEEVSPAELLEQIKQITDIIDVFLLVIQLGRFTGEQRAVVQKMEDMFGVGAREQTMILFTCGDELNYSIEDYISKAGDPLGQVVHKYGARYHVFNNKSQRGSQVRQLLEKMERMTKCETLISVERKLGDLQKLLDMIENILKEPAISHSSALIATLPVGVISVAVGGILIPVTLGASLITAGVVVGAEAALAAGAGAGAAAAAAGAGAGAAAAAAGAGVAAVAGTVAVAVNAAVDAVAGAVVGAVDYVAAGATIMFSSSKLSAFIKDTEKCLDEWHKVFEEFTKNLEEEATEDLGDSKTKAAMGVRCTTKIAVDATKFGENCAKIAANISASAVLSDIDLICVDVKELLQFKIRIFGSKSKLIKDNENKIRICKERLDDIDKQIKTELRRMRDCEGFKVREL